MSLSSEELIRQKDYTENCRELLRKRFGDREIKAYTHTFGCQGNVSDGEKIDGMLTEMGFTFTDKEEEADFILLNTCAVREHAEERVFGNLGRFKKYKRERPETIVAVCGCMAQQEEVASRIKVSFPYVDIVFGTHVLYKFPEIMYTFLMTGKRIFELTENNDGILEGIPVMRTNRIKSFLPITYGCNNFCTYCIVPYVRGRERSRSYEEVLREAGALVDAGYKEIMLLGQNVNSYGNDLGEKNLFPSLLREINDIPGDFVIRFMTSHPKDCSFELLDAMAECEKVESHLHLPVQSGSNDILKRMNRRYTREKYLGLVDYARKKMPDIALTSDIIVGFPGETYEDFRETLSLVEEVGFSSLYTFIYSPRPGTPAAGYPDPFTREEKQEWFEELMEKQAEIAGAKACEYKDWVMRVLTEGRNSKGKLFGRADNNIMVEFDGDDSLIGDFHNIRITDPLAFILKGQLVE